jgi:PAS domain S-box-containing protein
VAAILGYTTEELLGRTPFELMPPGEGKRIEAFFQRISANRAPIVDLENLNLHRDGSPVWLLTNGVPVQDDRGRLAGYFGVDKDITLRKQTEDALSLRLRELTALNVLSREVGAELSPASVFRKIFAGIREWVQPEQLLLFLPDDAGRMRLSDWHPDHLELRRGAPLSPPLETCLCHRAMTTGGIAASTDGEPPCCRLAAQLDGDAGPSAVAIPLGVGDRTVGLLQLMGQPSDALADSPEFLDSMAGIIASGIDKALLHQRVREQAERLEQTVAERTWELSDANARLRRENEERRKAQRELRAAKEEAEAANRTKSDFLARMSHEIRTPMNAILNMTELVRLTPLTGEQREHLESVAHSGQHLLNLINDILDISRIESGRLELETRDFNLVGLLRSTLGSMREQARKKGLYLELEIDDTFTPDLRGDPFRLQQILINLVGNAIKFTRSGGVTLGVTCRPDAECRPPSPEAGASTEIELRFQVADTGIGISPEVGEAVFDAFRQSDNSISRKYGGTGLGLAICHQLVFMMGGRLWFESLADGGTVFVFTVRLGPGTPGAEDGMDLPESLAGPSRRRPLDILLAEDNAENVRVARGLISKLGHRLTVAGNGMEALAKLRDEDFDVVLMDLEMPAMDGIEATRRIRNGEAGEAAKEVRIVALTAHALSGFREKCLAAGMDHYIAKPFSLAQLFGLLGRAKGAELSFSSGVSVSDGPVKGLDLEGAVGRLYGDEELYAELARAFLEKMPEKRERLRRLHRQSRWPELALIAHTLKGNCANIGAVACRRAAEALETASRDPHPPPASRLLRDLDDALEAARVDLSRWLENRKDRHSRKPEAPAEADAALTPEDLAALMDRLAEALSRGEVDDAAIDRLFSQPPDVLDPETLADLRRALDEFELERAGLRVQRLRLALLESPWEA